MNNDITLDFTNRFCCQTTHHSPQVENYSQRERELFILARVIIIVCVPCAALIHGLDKVEGMIKLSKPGTAEELAFLDKTKAHSKAVTAGSLDAVEEKVGKPKGPFRWLIW